MSIEVGNDRREQRGGIRLQRFNIIIAITAGVFAVVLLVFAYLSYQGYHSMQEATQQYITAQQYAADLEVASDYLTEQARAFAATGEKQYVDGYLQETHVDRRRENALENMEQFLAGDDSYRYLAAAVELSGQLEEIELYAMRLTLSSREYRMADFPEEIRSIPLETGDLYCSALQRSERAERILYDETYQSYKSRIKENIDRCTKRLIQITQQRQIDSSVRLSWLLRLECLLIVMLLITVFTMVLTTSVLVVRPMGLAVERIRQQEILNVTGSYEMRFLAEIYNQMFRENQRNQSKLSYEASHDDLTGLYNRGVFEKMRDALPEEEIALILVDVDYFKGFNDNYGHDVGDKVLKKVAAALHDNFRSEDYVCRIGGDEFAVIMVHTHSNLRELVENKVKNCQVRVGSEEDGLPAVTLSIGVAFGDREAPTDDIYKDADAALYQVKEAGRNGYAFYHAKPSGGT